MLKQIKLSHFQNHEHFQAEFDKRVTVLVGPSDSGKSAVLRALRWLMLNKPQGDDFIGNFGDAPFARCEIGIDKHVIVRKRGASNCYLFDGKRLKAFKHGVPDKVKHLLNVSEVNFQRQLDAPYWFLEAPAEVSRRLNGVIDLSVIDSSLENAARLVRNSKSEVELTRRRLREAKDKLASLAWVKQCHKDLQNIEDTEAQLAELTEQQKTLAFCIKEADRASARQNAVSIALTTHDGVAQAGAKVIEVTERLSNLKALLRKVEQAERLTQLRDDSFPELERVNRKLNKVRNEQRELDKLMLTAMQLIYEIETASALIADCDQRLKEVRVCPTCQRPLSQSWSATSTSTIGRRPADEKQKKSGTRRKRRISAKSDN